MSNPRRVIQKIEATHNAYTAFVLLLFTTSYCRSLAVGCLYLSIVPIETDMTVTKASKHDVLPVNITYPHVIE